MRLGILGDVHLRASKPQNRIDDYYRTQFDKLSSIFEHFQSLGVDSVLQPGDLFHDYGKDPYELTYEVIAFLMCYRMKFYVVYGQHDIKFHNLDCNDIPIQVINKTSLLNRVLNRKPKKLSDGVKLFGASWGEPIPKVKGNPQIPILMTHRMVTKKGPLWKGHEDYTLARNLLKTTNYKLIICGDNHKAFTYSKNNRHVINCGSMTRMSVDQFDHQPIYCVYDTYTDELQVFNVPIQDPVLVLKKSEHDRKKKSDEALDCFKRGLDSNFEADLNYRDNVNKVMKRKRVRKRTKDIVEEALNVE